MLFSLVKWVTLLILSTAVFCLIVCVCLFLWGFDLHLLPSESCGLLCGTGGKEDSLLASQC